MDMSKYSTILLIGDTEANMPELNKTVLLNNANLKAYYRFESGALTTDSSGNSHTLTAISDPTEGTGVFGGGVDFDGNDAYSHADHADFRPTSSFSIGAWVKASSAHDGNIFANYDTSAGKETGIQIGIRPSTGVFRLSIGKNTGSTLHTDYEVCDSTTNVCNGSFHLVIATWNGTSMRVYVDGKCETTVAWSGAPAYAAGNVPRIGCVYYQGSNNYFLTGSLEDFFLLNGAALSADQIKELYEGRFLGELRPNQFGTTAGLWHLNGNSTDSSGNGNNGTDTNITYSQANGKFGQGADFDGSTSKIDMGTSNIFNFTGDFTILMWLNPDSIANAAQLVRRGSSNGYQLQFDTTDARLALAPRGLTTVYSSNNAIVASAWQLIGVTRSSTTVTFYRNGSPWGTATVATINSDSGQNMIIGSDPSSSAGTEYNGKMDELYIASTALTANQIRTMYALGVGKYY